MLSAVVLCAAQGGKKLLHYVECCAERVEGAAIKQSSTAWTGVVVQSYVECCAGREGRKKSNRVQQSKQLLCAPVLST
eukprot:2535808-Rhodomonas_salina.1